MRSIFFAAITIPIVLLSLPRGSAEARPTPPPATAAAPAPAATAATPAAQAEARAAYNEGSRRYDIQDFRGALDAFKRAYLAWDNPAFLFNIAQCHRRLGERRQALGFLRTYGQRISDPSERALVERTIAELEAELRAEPQPQPQPQPQPAPAVAIVPGVQTSETPPARKQRRWVWPVVGASAVVVVGLAVGLGVGLTRPAPFESTLPDVQLLRGSGGRW